MSAMDNNENETEDDDFVPPTPVRVAHVVQICPVCSRTLKSHSTSEMFRCAEAGEGEEDQPSSTLPEVHVRKDDIKHYGPAPERKPEPVRESEPQADQGVIQRRMFPEQQTARWKPPPLPPKQDDDWIEALPDGKLLLPNGELDFERLASAMRTLHEKERNDMIRRGGPIEQQNMELKERLHEALAEADKWRRQAHSYAEQRNTFEQQLLEAHKANRQLRNELKGRKESGDHKRVLELNDLLEAIQGAKGWTLERSGNGHYKAKKNGVFVTDLASSGQGTKVNMASRLALKKAGLDV